jgi:hypothetical protein
MRRRTRDGAEWVASRMTVIESSRHDAKSEESLCPNVEAEGTVCSGRGGGEGRTGSRAIVRAGSRWPVRGSAPTGAYLLSLSDHDDCVHDIDITADTMKNFKKKIKSIVSPTPGRGSTSGAQSSPSLSSTTAQLAGLSVSQLASVTIEPPSAYSRYSISTCLTQLSAASTQPPISTTVGAVDSPVLTISHPRPVSVEPSSAY